MLFCVVIAFLWRRCETSSNNEARRNQWWCKGVVYCLRKVARRSWRRNGAEGRKKCENCGRIVNK